MNHVPQADEPAAPQEHGWFSPSHSKMKNERGEPIIYWETEDGRVVVVTEVTRTNEPSTSWGDSVYIGPVKCFFQCSEFPLNNVG